MNSLFFLIIVASIFERFYAQELTTSGFLIDIESQLFIGEKRI